jgi:hypothetical protein
MQMILADPKHLCDLCVAQFSVVCSCISKNLQIDDFAWSTKPFWL